MELWNENNLMGDEAALLRLKSLYRQYGYRPFRMRRFEEYDFYADKRSFLEGGRVLAFSDLNGKLMALRPDVTLSIIKSVPETGGMHKLCYSENVYRPGRGRSEQGFEEITQLGLECIGDIDLYSEGEVLLLAAESLALFGAAFTLDVSHMGFLLGLLDGLGADERRREAILGALGSRSESALRAICAGLPREGTQALCALASLYGGFPEGLMRLRALSGENAACLAALDELEALCALLAGTPCETALHLDFSIMNDMRYYNGLMFRGFIEGLPQSVLSGGRYDGLVQAMGKKAGAIGFSIYLNALERLLLAGGGTDTDVYISYDDTTPPALVAQKARALTGAGYRVFAEKEGGAKRRAKRHIHFCAGEVQEIEG